MLAEEVKLDLGRHRRPFEMVQSVRGLDLAPAGPSFKDSLNDAVVVPSHEDELVQVLLGLKLLLV